LGHVYPAKEAIASCTPQLLLVPNQFFYNSTVAFARIYKGKVRFMWICENGEEWWWVTAEELKQ